jgi:hypothetical protein
MRDTYIKVEHQQIQYLMFDSIELANQIKIQINEKLKIIHRHYQPHIGNNKRMSACKLF